MKESQSPQKEFEALAMLLSYQNVAQDSLKYIKDKEIDAIKKYLYPNSRLSFIMVFVKNRFCDTLKAL